MNFIPRRRKYRPMSVQAPDRVICPGHMKWVRGHVCVIEGNNGHVCSGRMEAHHVTSRGAHGGDNEVVCLCAGAHADGHLRGWETFQKEFSVDLHKIAAEFWDASPHKRKFEQAWKEQWPGVALPYGGR